MLNDPSYPVVTDKAVYMMIGQATGMDAYTNYQALGFFTFHVGDQAVFGSELHWMREGSTVDNGITTALYDDHNMYHKITDNWLVIVPEPGALAAIGAGLASLLMVRRRR